MLFRPRVTINQLPKPALARGTSARRRDTSGPCVETTPVIESAGARCKFDRIFLTEGQTRQPEAAALTPPYITTKTASHT